MAGIFLSEAILRPGLFRGVLWKIDLSDQVIVVFSLGCVKQLIRELSSDWICWQPIKGQSRAVEDTGDLSRAVK